MYLRRCYRDKDGKRHAYWALVESYRTARGPRQRVGARLGANDQQGRMGVKRCAANAAIPRSLAGTDATAVNAAIDILAKDIRTPIVDPPATAKGAYPIAGLSFILRATCKITLRP